MVGGDDDDVIRSGTGNSRIEGNGGNDSLFSGLGNSVIDGGIGDDRINAGTGSNILIGGPGNDAIVGGKAGDFFIHSEGETGNDSYDGAGGQDTLLFFANNSGTVFSVAPSSSQVQVSGRYLAGAFSIQLLGIGQILASITGGASSLSVADSPDTELSFVGFDLGATANGADQIEFVGTSNSDKLDIAENTGETERAMDLVGGATSLRILIQLPMTA